MIVGKDFPYDIFWTVFWIRTHSKECLLEYEAEIVSNVAIIVTIFQCRTHLTALSLASIVSVSSANTFTSFSRPGSVKTRFSLVVSEILPIWYSSAFDVIGKDDPGPTPQEPPPPKKKKNTGFSPVHKVGNYWSVTVNEQVWTPRPYNRRLSRLLDIIF